MNKETIDLKFLYHQKKAVLGGEDSIDKAMSELKFKFYDKMISLSLKEVLRIIICAYKDEYANHSCFKACFFDVNSPLDSLNKPAHIRKQDFYISNNEMARVDIEYLLLKTYKDPNENSPLSYLEEMEIGFVAPQEFDLFIDLLLEGKTFTRNSIDDTFVYKVEDSPIYQIKLFQQQFVLTINQAFWKGYY